MKNKVKYLELLIFLIIIIIIIITLILTNKIINNKPEISNTNDIKNYSVTKYIKYSIDSNNVNIYNPPLNTYINYQHSTYDIYLTSTDNIITDITENITIYYNHYPSENENIIINFCNNYDEIENKYRLQCQKYPDRIILSNNFNIAKINSNSLKTSEYNINLPIKTNTRLNEYIKTLNKNNITYYEITNLP